MLRIRFARVGYNQENSVWEPVKVPCSALPLRLYYFIVVAKKKKRSVWCTFHVSSAACKAKPFGEIWRSRDTESPTSARPTRITSEIDQTKSDRLPAYSYVTGGITEASATTKETFIKLLTKLALEWSILSNRRFSAICVRNTNIQLLFSVQSAHIYVTPLHVSCQFVVTSA